MRDEQKREGGMASKSYVVKETGEGAREERREQMGWKGGAGKGKRPKVSFDFGMESNHLLPEAVTELLERAQGGSG